MSFTDDGSPLFSDFSVTGTFSYRYNTILLPMLFIKEEGCYQMKAVHCFRLSRGRNQQSAARRYCDAVGREVGLCFSKCPKDCYENWEIKGFMLGKWKKGHVRCLNGGFSPSCPAPFHL